ncbi:SDR family oxidoreductase [Marinomonas mediterranea]|uniref:SDR family oxidoreductase n=1 Tax=Marinomonas mediterranea TaxID=119864 RepID=UPI00234B1102|nr:SDR family oxidoreductase [Marinomonas mediterranea]WCN07533.1 SDR family oxidoreductase [Marinomonas mediterranea]
MGRLAQKYALITGGSAGIGFETARQFIAEGAEVLITGRHAEGLEKAKALLGDHAHIFQNDAGDIASQQALSCYIADTFPRLDIVFVNAGDVTHLPVADWDEAAFDRVISTNLKGPFFLIQSLQALLSGSASIILCGSVSAQIGLPQSSVYAASKAGLLSLSRTLSGELKHLGIRVNSLSPGPTETDAFDKFGLPQKEKEALKEQVRQLVPLGRMGRTEELAKAAVFLASDESSYMLGSELLVDGGVGNV